MLMAYTLWYVLIRCLQYHGCFLGIFGQVVWYSMDLWICSIIHCNGCYLQHYLIIWKYISTDIPAHYLSGVALLCCDEGCESADTKGVWAVLVETYKETDKAQWGITPLALSWNGCLYQFVVHWEKSLDDRSATCYPYDPVQTIKPLVVGIMYGGIAIVFA